MEEIKFQFVNTELSASDGKRIMPASYLRQSFKVNEVVKKATLYTTALGVYVPYFNGVKVSEQVLLPGFTDYNKRVQYIASDITELVRPGNNSIAAIISDGWYRGTLGFSCNRNVYGNKLKFAATIMLETDNGIKWFYTNSNARATQDGPITASDIKTDEMVDATKEMSGWTTPEFDDTSWHLCSPAVYEGAVIPQEGEEILEQEHFKANVLHTPNGETVIDFGQNMAGHVSFTVTGKAGHTVMLTFGEILDEKGNFTVKNLSNDETLKNARRLGQKLTYTLKDGTQSYKPLFLVSGFRYAKIENWPEEVKAENFEAIAIYSNLKESGTFSCSNPKINQFVSNVKWSWRSNSVDIPTDCPQRERAGWTGDINVFAETACWHTNTEKFLQKWLHDYIGLQEENGNLPFIVPEITPKTAKFSMHMAYSSAGWSDALIDIAMTMYQFYGDKTILETVFESAKKYVDYNLQRARKKHPLHFYKRGKWYNYILDTGFHWGEWLEPDCSVMADMAKAVFAPDSEVATAWLYSSTKQVSEMATILDYTNDSQKYGELACKIREAYRKEFLKDGKVVSGRQCRYVRPLYLGLTTKEVAKEIASELNNMVITNNYKIGTGFLTTCKILQTLTDYGFVDTAYKMMEQENCPGWLYEVTKGATTTWEAWDAIRPDGTLNAVSLNHFAPGAACSWLFSHVGGIQPLMPGFTKTQIKPIPGGTLTYANTSYISPKGKIISNWRIDDNYFYLHVEIPERVEADVILPDKTTATINSGSYDYQCVLE